MFGSLLVEAVLLNGEVTMTKIIVLMAVAFALAAGSITTMTFQSQQAAERKAAFLQDSIPLFAARVKGSSFSIVAANKTE
jgi:thiazole synthase ThiGH ThiG subunit